MTRPAWLVIALLAVPGPVASQTRAVLRIHVTLADAAGAPLPVARHVLLVSDNPATREPRRVVTAADGTASVTVPPGSYTVESDRPVTVLGKAYQWTHMVEVRPGGDTRLELTATNADIVEADPSAGLTAPSAPPADPTLAVTRWQASVLTVWSPTARSSGFVVDARGAVATSSAAIGKTTDVEIQVSATTKVAGRVLVADQASGVAIIRVDPTVVAAAPQVPLPCAAASSATIDDGQEILALVSSADGPLDPVSGTVMALEPRAVETDLRLPFGGAGGPVFNEAGTVVGLTSASADPDVRRRRDVAVIRVVAVCAALSSVQAGLEAAPPSTRALPVEPAASFPSSALPVSPAAPAALEPLVVTSPDFDVAFLTPSVVAHAQQRADWTGGRSGRSPEAEARLGRITDFGSWSDYFATSPAVLAVRVSPKLVEGFWKRLAREAARTQGAALPPFKDFKTSFLRLRATCGSAEVTPIHPFVIEHEVSDKAVVREGLYIFDPGAFGPHCQGVTLALIDEKAPGQADTVTVSQAIVERIWNDFAPYRAAARP